MVTMMEQDAGSMTPESVNAKSQAGAQQAIGKAAPQALEPLDDTLVNTLGEVAKTTAEKLAGEEIGEINIARVSGAQQQLPADVFSLVVVFDAFAQQAGLPVRFDLERQAASNDGLKELIDLIGQVGGSADAGKAARAPASPPKPPEPEKPKGPDLAAERFMKKEKQP